MAARALPARLPFAMEVLARTLLVLLVATTAVLSAPSVGFYGRGRESNAQPPPSRVTRQAPGSDILTRLSEAFREKMQQKSEGVMDAVDQVGKALGALGDTVHQAITDGLTAGAEVADGQRAAGAGAGQAGDLGQKVGEVLTSIGDTLHQVVAGGGGQDGGQRTAVPGAAGADPGPDAPLGHILTSIGDKLRTAANGGEDGERALGQVGQQVGKVLASVGDTIRDVIRERQEGDDDDDGVARLVSEPGVDAEKVPCNAMNATMDAMNVMNGNRRRGRGRRAASS